MSIEHTDIKVYVFQGRLQVQLFCLLVECRIAPNNEAKNIRFSILTEPKMSTVSKKFSIVCKFWIRTDAFTVKGVRI